jgi:hypothetical protein
MNGLRLQTELIKEGYAHEHPNPKVIIDYFDLNIVATIVACPKVIQGFKIRYCDISVGNHLVQHGKQRTMS